jgi:hypothetical protein
MKREVATVVVEAMRMMEGQGEVGLTVWFLRSSFRDSAKSTWRAKKRIAMSNQLKVSTQSLNRILTVGRQLKSRNRSGWISALKNKIWRLNKKKMMI